MRVFSLSWNTEGATLSVTRWESVIGLCPSCEKRVKGRSQSEERR